MTARDPRPEERDSLVELSPRLRERVLALDEPVPWDDWSDVVRRSRASVSWSRRVVTFGALAATLAVAAATAAVVVSVDRSRSPVWQDFSSFAVSPVPLNQPEAISSQTRIVTSTQLSDGKHTLVVSPTKEGGFCYEWTGGAGGCDQLRPTSLSATWVHGKIVGTANSAQVSSVKILFTDGTSAIPKISWISAPIDAGFFLYAIPAGKTVVRVEALAGGRPQRQITWFSV